MAWSDVQAIPPLRMLDLQRLFSQGVFGWAADHRREYSMMVGFNSVTNAVATTASKKNRPLKMPKFQKLFPVVDRMMRLGISRAALVMDRMNKERFRAKN